MKIAVLSAVLVAGGIGLYLLPSPGAQNIDPFTSGSIGSSEASEFAVANLQTGTACTVTRGRALTAKSRALDVGVDCEAVWSGLSAARNWTENDDGSVALTDKSGHQLLYLTPGDGIAFEAYEPATAQISLTVLR